MKAGSGSILALGWFPADPAYRTAVEAEMMAAFDHFRAHGSTALIQKVVALIPNRDVRLHMQRELVRVFPLVIREDAGTISLDRERARDFPWDRTPMPRLFPPKIAPRSDSIAVGGVEWTPGEFLSEVTDLLILARDRLASSDLETLRATIEAILERRDRSDRPS